MKEANSLMEEFIAENFLQLLSLHFFETYHDTVCICWYPFKLPYRYR